MSVAAEHRANVVAQEILYRGIREQYKREDVIKAIEVAEECNAFSRQAMDYIVEPRGMRQPAIERAKAKRGWSKRAEAVAVAHSAWVDVDSSKVVAYHSACVDRAKAIYELLTFALGGWEIPNHIHVPRAAK